MFLEDEEIINCAPPNAFFYAPICGLYLDGGGCPLNWEGKWCELGPDTVEEPTRSLADIREILELKAQFMFNSVEDYESAVGGTVNEAFKIGWALSRNILK
jgi:hypothetical protein